MKNINSASMLQTRQTTMNVVPNVATMGVHKVTARTESGQIVRKEPISFSLCGRLQGCKKRLSVDSIRFQ